MSALLNRLQHRLCELYDVDPGCEVADFVVSDRAQLPPHVASTGTDEHVFALAEHDALSISVFIDREVLGRLAGQDPLQRLDGANIADFWTALEAVSHFLCLAWNARHDRGVSVLALEMQSDIDKFVLSAGLLREQGARGLLPELHVLLFGRCRVDPRLAAGRDALYRAASAHAAKFCRRLERTLDGSALGSELRRFYRLADLGKMDYIRAC